MIRLVLFDVNKTLLDLAALDETFETAFGQASARQEWFGQMLRTAFVTTLTGPYHDFSALARAALAMTARRHGLALDEAQKRRILQGVRSLPPHSDVLPALNRLQAAGLRLATLSNSTGKVTRAQLTHAGLAPYFEQMLSADAVRRLKPAPEPYAYAARQLGLSPADMLFIAAHVWDLAGAHQAGFRTAFIARQGSNWDPLYPTPDFDTPDLLQLSDALLPS